MKMGKESRRFNWKEYFMWVLVLGYIFTGVVILPLQVAVFILVKPWSLWLHRKISYYFSLVMYWHPIFLTLWWSNTKIEIFIDSKDLHGNMGNEHSIFLSNHRYETETFMKMAIWSYFKSLGNLRAFSKKNIQYLPITGWLWKLQEHIFVERHYENDKEIVNREVKSLMKHSDAVTLVLFPEGTRFTKEKHKASMIVAKEKGLQELKYHLLPRTRGFATCIDTLKKGTNFGLPVVIYDALFVMESQNGEGTTFSILDLLRGYGPNVKLLLRRYPLDSIPKNENECSQWLHRIYQEKDKFMETCLKTGKFFKYNNENKSEPNLKGFDSIKIPKPLGILLLIGCLNVICLVCTLIQIVYVLKGGDMFQLIAFTVITVIGNIIYSVITDSSKIKNGSSYGRI